MINDLVLLNTKHTNCLGERYRKENPPSLSFSLESAIEFIYEMFCHEQKWQTHSIDRWWSITYWSILPSKLTWYYAIGIEYSQNTYSTPSQNTVPLPFRYTVGLFRGQVQEIQSARSNNKLQSTTHSWKPEPRKNNILRGNDRRNQNKSNQQKKNKNQTKSLVECRDILCCFSLCTF